MAKYFVEEMTVLKDGTYPVAITNKETKEEALSALHQTLASAYINGEVVTCHVEVKDELGNIIKKDDKKAE